MSKLRRRNADKPNIDGDTKGKLFRGNRQHTLMMEAFKNERFSFNSSKPITDEYMRSIYLPQLKRDKILKNMVLAPLAPRRDYNPNKRAKNILSTNTEEDGKNGRTEEEKKEDDEFFRNDEKPEWHANLVKPPIGGLKQKRHFAKKIKEVAIELEKKKKTKWSHAHSFNAITVLKPYAKVSDRQQAYLIELEGGKDKLRTDLLIGEGKNTKKLIEANQRLLQLKKQKSSHNETLRVDRTGSGLGSGENRLGKSLDILSPNRSNENSLSLSSAAENRKRRFEKKKSIGNKSILEVDRDFVPAFNNSINKIEYIEMDRTSSLSRRGSRDLANAFIEDTKNKKKLRNASNPLLPSANAKSKVAPVDGNDKTGLHVVSRHGKGDRSLKSLAEKPRNWRGANGGFSRGFKDDRPIGEREIKRKKGK